LNALSPGSKVRFQVVDGNGRRGSSWSIATAKHKPDVYLTHREGGTWIHISMHRDGRRHHAVTAAGQERLPDVPKYLGVTHASAPLAPGWQHQVRILVAETELSMDWQEGVPEAKNIVNVPIHADFDAVSIDVLLSEPGSPMVGMDLAYPVAEIERAGGGLAVVVARPTLLAVPVRSAYADALLEAIQGLTDQGWDGARSRLVIFGEDDEGFSREVEFAVDPREQ
jgi:hypothetical protein